MYHAQYTNFITCISVGRARTHTQTHHAGFHDIATVTCYSVTNALVA
jgi:hypothetical protein